MCAKSTEVGALLPRVSLVEGSMLPGFLLVSIVPVVVSESSRVFKASGGSLARMSENAGLGDRRASAAKAASITSSVQSGKFMTVKFVKT